LPTVQTKSAVKDMEVDDNTSPAVQAYSMSSNVNPCRNTAPKVNQTRKSNGFSCHLCASVLTRKHDLKRHITSHHGEAEALKLESGNCCCLDCDRKFKKIVELKKHLSTAHSMIFHEEELSFDTVEGFENWKSDMEEKHCVFYSCLTGKRKDIENSCSYNYFNCSRSGVYKASGSGKRRLKSCGSIKIGHTCTSNIKVTYFDDGKVKTSVCYTHYGHEVELRHCRLTKKQKKVIALKLKDGVAKTKILDSIRDNFEGPFQRIPLLQNKDMRNIPISFGLDDTRRREDDQTSVRSWIHDWSLREDTPFLYYKLEGEVAGDTNPYLKKEDFVIIIQTPIQRQLLKKFGSKGICNDSTHGTTEYDFILNTLLVIDEFGECQPVAWCLANQETEEFMILFFTHVKNACGKVSPVWFMSDTALQTYDAYCIVMECCPHHLLCLLHVDKVWQEEVVEKIKDTKKQFITYKFLRLILEETDQRLFTKNLNIFIQEINIPKTSNFHDYFVQQWSLIPTKWAYCHRVGYAINTNMSTEAFHRTFEYDYLKEKYNKRVDGCLANLLKFARDQSFNRITELLKGKNTYFMKLITNRHNNSLEMDVANVTHFEETDHINKYHVTSSKGVKTYVVIKKKQDCSDDTCRLRCMSCFICPHQLCCTCQDFLGNSFSCKHLHLVERFLGNPEGQQVAINHVAQGENDEVYCTIQEAHIPSGVDNEVRAVVDMLKSLQLQVETDQPRLEVLKQLKKDLYEATLTYQTISYSSEHSYSMPSKKVNLNVGI